jgi:hypothetical protein
LSVNCPSNEIRVATRVKSVINNDEISNWICVWLNEN